MLLLRAEKMELLPERDIIAVHQMGKVGSTSVYQGLKNARPDLKVLHSHHYRPETILKMIRKTITPEGVIPPHLRDGVELRYLVKRAVRQEQRKPGSGSRIHLISLVRDPIARNISAFFENIERWIARLPPSEQAVLNATLDASPSAKFDSARLAAAVGSLQSVFTERYKHGIAENWMEEELAEPMGFEFSKPFDHTKGYTIYEQPPFRVLVFVLERLNETMGSGIEEFLAIRGLKTSTANKGESKRYATVYRVFMDSIRLPESYLDQMYSGKLMRYFYSEQALAGFRAKWSKNSS